MPAGPPRRARPSRPRRPARRRSRARRPMRTAGRRRPAAEARTAASRRGYSTAIAGRQQVVADRDAREPELIAQEPGGDLVRQNGGRAGAEGGVGGRRDHHQVDSLLDRGPERLEVRLERPSARRRSRSGQGPCSRPPVPARGSASRSRPPPPRRCPEANASPRRATCGRVRSERSRRHELDVGAGDVQHRGEVHVDAQLAQLKPGRAALQYGGLAVVVLGDRVGRDLRRQRGQALDDPALLVDRDQQRGVAARGGGRLQALELRRQPIARDLGGREQDHAADLAGARLPQELRRRPALHPHHHALAGDVVERRARRLAEAGVGHRLRGVVAGARTDQRAAERRQRSDRAQRTASSDCRGRTHAAQPTPTARASRVVA